ncbi:MAG: hypothetical protein KGL39_19305 [Patescibacteria group bacterium]|nr:hypothetical protein [Patescibacteria group bacterium]
MNIHKIARMQWNDESTLYFASKGTSDCYWFDPHGVVRKYNDIFPDGFHVALTLDDIEANDWRIIKRS